MNALLHFSFLILLSDVMHTNVNGLSIGDQRTRAKRRTDCRTRLPEAEWFRYGYDATEIDIYNCPETGGKKEIVFDVDDCSRDQKWLNRHMNTTFDVPNEIHVYDLMSNNDVQDVYTNIQSYDEHLSSDISIEHDYEHGLFSLSEHFIDMQQKLSRNSAVVYRKSEELYSIEHKRGIKNSSFERAQNDLPDEFAPNPTKYIEFIKMYGTHYIERSSFGRIVRKLAIFDKRKYKNYDHYAFLTKVADGFPYVDSKDTVMCTGKMNDTIKFKNEDQNYELQYFGGEADEIKSLGYDKWHEAIAPQSYAMRIRLTPLSQLFTGSKASEMEKAIKNYMELAYLEENVRQLNIQISLGLPKTNVTEALLEEVEKFQNSSVYDINETRDLTRKVRFEARRSFTIVYDGNGADSIRALHSLTFILIVFVIWFKSDA